MTISKKCYVCIKTLDGESQEIGPVFVSKNNAEEWCHHKNTEDSSTALWYLEECELR